MIRAILFDLDGTLVDSIDDIHAAANRLLAELELPAIDRATVKGFVGNGIPALVERCLRHQGGDLRDLPARIRRFKAIYEELGHRHTVLYPGAATALAMLSARGYRLGLCTNKDLAPSRKILAQLGIDGFFDSLVGGDSLSVGKPDPRPLIAAADGCDATLDECLYVGDSEVDAAASHRAFVPFLLYSEGYRKGPVADLAPIASFSDFRALPALVESLRRTVG